MRQTWRPFDRGAEAMCVSYIVLCITLSDREEVFDELTCYYPSDHSQ
jgi:hypothetical protein